VVEVVGAGLVGTDDGLPVLFDDFLSLLHAAKTATQQSAMAARRPTEDEARGVCCRSMRGP
jgi:hypothetical protein